MERDEDAGFEAGNYHTQRLDRAALIVEVGGHFGHILAGQIDGGVEQMGTRIEQEPTAGHCRDLAPGVDGIDPPVLPDHAADRLDGADVAVAQHGCRCAYIGRQTAGERHYEQLAGFVARRNQALGLAAGHHHGFFEQHVDAGLEAGFGLIVVEHMRRDDEGRIDLAALVTEQFGQIGLVRRHGDAGFFEHRGGFFVGLCRWLADDTDGRSGLHFEHVADVMAGHAAAANHDGSRFGHHCLLIGCIRACIVPAL